GRRSASPLPHGPPPRSRAWAPRTRSSPRSRSTRCSCCRGVRSRWRRASSRRRKETTMLAEGTLDGRVAIVTGGGSGMGRAMALEFARLGAGVVVAGRRPEPLEETVALIEDAGGRAAHKPMDVREPDEVDELVATAVKHLGRVDVLVNNAAGNFV